MAHDHPLWGHLSNKEASTQCQAIEKFCIEIAPTQSAEKFDHECKQFSTASEAVGKTLEAFSLALAQVSLISLILLWSKSTAQDRVIGERNLRFMNELLVSKVFPLVTGNKLIFLNDVGTLNHQSIIDAIRCHAQWPIQLREDYVCFYIDFANWMSSSTYGYISLAKDLDRELAARRQLPHTAFTKLITYLPDRERILAKLFYLGGDRGLEEVLSLKIEDVDFQTAKINYEKHFVRYPQHVIADILDYIGSRKRGFVFNNKAGERINHTVPYRAFKVAAQKLNLPSTFTIKDLVKDF